MAAGMLTEATALAQGGEARIRAGLISRQPMRTQGQYRLAAAQSLSDGQR